MKRLVVYVLFGLLLVQNSFSQTITGSFDFSLDYSELVFAPKPGTRTPTKNNPTALDGYSCSHNDVTLSFNTGGNPESTSPVWINVGGIGLLEIHMYEANSLTVEAPANYKINKVTFMQSRGSTTWNGWRVSGNGSWKTKVWTPDASVEYKSVTFIADGGSDYFCKITVSCSQSTLAGIDTVVETNIDESPEYYTVDGVKLQSEPTKSGVYIVKTGARTHKIFIP